MLLPCNIYAIRMQKLSFCVALSTFSLAKAWLLPCKSTPFSDETAIFRLFPLISHFGKALRQPSPSPKTASQGEAFAMSKCKHRSASAYTLTPLISPYYKNINIKNIHVVLLSGCLVVLLSGCLVVWLFSCLSI